MTMWVLFDGLLIAVGYIASIYTWPWIRTKIIGVEAEADALRDRASAIITKARTP